MKKFSEKVRDNRRLLKLSQAQLGELVGISGRAVLAYEAGEARPRRRTLLKLAEALQVSAEYLSNDEIDNPTYGLEKQSYIEETRERFGNKAAKEIDFLMERNTALFAGGDISDEAKEAYFQAVMKAYLACKEEAQKTYGRKNP